MNFLQRGRRDCDKDQRHSARGFVCYQERTRCLAEAPRSTVIKRSTTQQCHVMQIVSCTKTGKGQIQRKARRSGVIDGTTRNTGMLDGIIKAGVTIVHNGKADSDSKSMSRRREAGGKGRRGRGTCNIPVVVPSIVARRCQNVHLNEVVLQSL